MYYIVNNRTTIIQVYIFIRDVNEAREFEARTLEAEARSLEAEAWTLEAEAAIFLCLLATASIVICFIGRHKCFQPVKTSCSNQPESICTMVMVYTSGLK